MDRIKNFFSKKNNVIALCLTILSTYFLFPSYFDNVVMPTTYESGKSWITLDTSWSLALNYANIKDLTWGKDIAFTYGPLSYLSLRSGWGQARLSFLLFDLFFVFNLFCLFFTSFRNAKNKVFAGLFILLAVVFSPERIEGAYSLLFFMFLIFWIRKNLETPKTANYLIQCLLLTLLFFLKFNTGIISFVVYYMALAYMAWYKKNKIPTIILFAFLPLVLIAIFAAVLNVNLPGYIASGFQLVSGYNSIMYSDSAELLNIKIFALLFSAAAFIFLVFKFFKERALYIKNALIFIAFGIGLFVLYKQSFVRSDQAHVLDFFRYAMFFVLAIQEFTTLKINNYRSLFVVAMLGLYGYVGFVHIHPSEYDLKQKLVKDNYISGFKVFTNVSGMRLFPNTNQLPDEIIKKIGNNTVDVFPWDIHMLLENGLNYHPRPVLQSYSAYTKSLENLNFDFYNSKNAPKYVFYDIDAIDNRYAVLDEPKVNVVLLKNYTVAASFVYKERSILLLERKNNAGPISFEFIKEYQQSIDAPLTPEAGLFYELEIHHTLKGKITSVSNHAPPLFLRITGVDNQTNEYRTSPELLSSGLFLNKFIRSTEDFRACFDDNGKVTNISQYSFRPDEASMFNNEITIKVYKIK